MENIQFIYTSRIYTTFITEFTGYLSQIFLCLKGNNILSNNEIDIVSKCVVRCWTT